jgi:G8 domain
MKKNLQLVKQIALALVLLVTATVVNAQTRTATTDGPWNSTTTWGGAAVPTATQTVTINSGVTVTLNASTAALSSLTINSGGTLTTTGTFTISATTIALNGTLTRNGTGGITVTTMTVGSTGTYTHAFNGGTIPNATWNAASTCNITGVTNTLPANSTQTFGNLTWNCAGQTDTDFPATININGTLTIANTNGQEARPNDGSVNTIGGNYVHSGGVIRWTRNTAGSVTVTGNVSISGGECRLSNGNQVGTLSVGGNFSHTAGVLTETGTGSGSVIFPTGTHSFTSGGTVSNAINWTVNNGATLNMAAAGTVVSGNAFTVANGGTLGITAAAGIVTAPTASGNIQTTTRTFNAGGNYNYIGSASQVTGNALPASINNLTVNNSNGVTLTNAVTLNSATTPLTLTNGIVSGAAITISAAYTGAGGGGSASSHVNGAMSKTGSTNFTFPIGNGTLYRPISVSNLSTSATISATYFLANPRTAHGTNLGSGLYNVSLCEYWDLNDGAATITGRVGLEFSSVSPCNANGYVTDPATLVVAHWNGSQWDNLGSNGTATMTSVTANTTSTFSPFTIGSTSVLNPLPVSFTDVKAFEKSAGVQVEWTNATESDMSAYVIERSANGIDFTAIGQTAPRSNQFDRVSYTYIDAAPL